MTDDLARDPPESRLEVERCVMLYDPSIAGNFAACWFDPVFWEAAGALRGSASGRGSTLFFVSDGQEYALRHYRRGGLVARLIADRYLNFGESRARSLLEFRVTQRLQRLGLPVAPVVAARYLPQGISYRCDLITVRLRDVDTLADCLGRTGERCLQLEDWTQLGAVLADFHAAGLDHADLNAHNILRRFSGSWYLLDFDRARFRDPGLWSDGNLVRLRRSLLKLCDIKDINFDEAWWAALLAGYRDALSARK